MRSLAALLALAFVAVARAAEPPVPVPQGWVTDLAHVIGPEVRGRIERLAQELRDKTGAEIAVVTVETTAPLDEVASTVNALGRCNVGDVVSRTSTLKLPLAVTWNELVAEQVTECAARLSGETENVVPDAGVQ